MPPRVSINRRLGDEIKSKMFDILRVARSSRSKVLRIVAKMESEVAAELARTDPTARARTAYRQARLEELLEGAQDIMESRFGIIAGNQKTELRELAELTYVSTGKSVNRVMGVKMTDTFISKEQYEALADNTIIMGAKSGEWWERQSRRTSEKFADAMRVGVARGETLQELTQRVRGGVRQGVQIQGVMQATRRNAEALVRSSYLTVANEARRALYKDNSDIIKGIQQVSTLDGRTTPICMAYSGATWDLDFDPIEGNTLPYNGGAPRHWNCRSVEVPITKSASEILGIEGLPDIPKGTRESMDGAVPADLSFDDWLKGKDAQNPRFTDKMLGVGKAALWREGKIGLQDLVTHVGEQKTLAQLRMEIGEE